MEQGKQAGNSRIGIWLPLLFSITLIVGILIGMRLSQEVPVVVLDKNAQLSISSSQGKLEELLRYIESKYVDSVDRDQLVEDAVYSILEQLDPHSSYIPADDLPHANEQLEGNFEGIGVEYMILEDTMVVVTPLPGGPSEEAGIIAGDKIVEVDDSTIAGIGLHKTDLISLLRGRKGTKVVVGVQRGAKKDLRRFTITRDEIPLKTLDAAYMVDEKTGYIKLNFFSSTTYDEFMKALEQLVDEEGLENLILDLRHNPGGYLQQATQLLSQLFPEKGKLLVYTQGNSAHRTEYKSHGRALFPIDQLAVLIDENSASASEIVAGALQDHDRAIVVGRRSFGKGLVQEPYVMRDGSALRLTVARFYTPSGRSIQKPYKGREDYREDVWHRIENGELTIENRQIVLDSTPYYTDNGRVVYGGGGIQPDIFVPINPIYYDEDFLEARPHIREFIYLQTQEGLLAETDIASETLTLQRNLLPDLMGDFQDFLSDKGVSMEQQQWTSIEQPLQLHLSAQIGELFYGKEMYFKFLNKEDPVIQKAVQALTDPSPITQNHK